MVSLEQVKLLESKVSRMIEYVKKVNEENKKLKDKLDSYEKRTGELEVLFQRFKDDQGRIEDGILAALDLLNQFEDTVETKLGSTENAQQEAPAAPAAKTQVKAVAREEEAAEMPEEAGEEQEEFIDLISEASMDEEDQGISSTELDIF